MLDLRALNLSCWGFKPFMSYINSVLLWPGDWLANVGWHAAGYGYGMVLANVLATWGMGRVWR